MVKALQLFRIIGAAYAKSHPDDDFVRHNFFMQVSQGLYPKNTHRRGWGYDNLQLFYNNEREYQLTLDEIRLEKVRRTKDEKLTELFNDLKQNIAFEYGWDSKKMSYDLWWMDHSPQHAHNRLDEKFKRKSKLLDLELDG